MSTIPVNYFKKNFINIIRFLFPNYCKNCDKLLDEEDKNCYCLKCGEEIKVIKKDYCIKCGRPVITANGICRYCKNTKFYYKQIRVVGIYEKILKDAIHLYKYSFRWKISRDFMNLIKNNIPKNYINNNDFLIFTPVTYDELIKKGFHHTKKMSEMISKEYNIPMIKNLIIGQIS